MHITVPKRKPTLRVSAPGPYQSAQPDIYGPTRNTCVLRAQALKTAAMMRVRYNGASWAKWRAALAMRRYV